MEIRGRKRKSYEKNGIGKELKKSKRKPIKRVEKKKRKPIETIEKKKINQ